MFFLDSQLLLFKKKEIVCPFQKLLIICNLSCHMYGPNLKKMFWQDQYGIWAMWVQKLECVQKFTKIIVNMLEDTFLIHFFSR